MSDSGYLEAVVAWALACLRGKEGAARARVEKKAVGRPIERVAERFGLDTSERRIVELAYAVESSIEVAREARTRGGLTVEVARETLADARVDALLAPGSTLRRRGLVAVADGWLGGAAAPIALAPGLARRLDGEDPSAAHLGPCARRITLDDVERFAEQFPPTGRIVEVVKEHSSSGVLSVEGCGRREAWALAVAAVRAHGRAALVVDGEALAPLDGAWTLLAAARRDADLDGALLFVVQSAALGETWRAAAVEAAPGMYPLVVFADAARPREIAPDEGLAPRSVVLPPLSATLPSTVTTPGPKKDDDGFDHIRAQAIRDAERALGIVRRDPVKMPISPPARPITSPVAPQAAAASTTAPATPASAPPVAAPAPKPAAPVAAPASAPPAAATTAPATPPADDKSKRRSRKGMLHFGEAAAPPPPAAAPAPAVAEPPAAPIAAAAPEPAASTAPFVDVPADAPPELLARIASTCPNPNQRIDVILKLGGFRNSAVIAALRSNTHSEHPGVRAAAEAAMSALFGPEWNRSRPVPKPVQRAADDKDRGPPGGF